MSPESEVENFDKTQGGVIKVKAKSEMLRKRTMDEADRERTRERKTQHEKQYDVTGRAIRHTGMSNARMAARSLAISAIDPAKR